MNRPGCSAAVPRVAPRSWAARVLVILALVALVRFSWLATARALTFLPQKATIANLEPARRALVGAQLVQIPSTEGVTLVGWWIPNEKRSSLSCGAVLVLNGNKGNISQRAGIARGFSARGLGVMLFDYRGFGASTGEPTEPGLYADAVTAYRTLTEKFSVPPERIILFGHSLGALVAMQLASRFQVGGLILLAPYVSLSHALHSGVKVLPTWASPFQDDQYSAVETAPRIRAPALVVSGGADWLVTRETTDSVYSLIPAKKWRVHSAHASHNTLSGDKTVWRTIDEVLPQMLRCEHKSVSASLR